MARSGTASGAATAAATSSDGRASQGLRLSELLAQLPDCRLRKPCDGAPPDPTISGVRQDSRQVQEGELFVALSGGHVDGAAYVASAADRGAAAVLHRAGRQLDAAGLPCIEAAEPRRAMARAAAVVYGRPTEALKVVGITGTNGKTTTAHLVHHAISACGGQPAIVGTLGYCFADVDHAASLTSPEADDLQRLAHAMRQRGASHLVMEVSSIALAADRVRDVRFQVAAFTNLTQDHLDYHGSMEAYAAAKEQLFFEASPDVAVINVDDPFGAALADRVAARAACRLLRVSTGAQDADVRATDLSLSPEGISLQVAAPSGSATMKAPLVGAHNVANLICTAAIIEALGLPLGPASAGLSAAPAVPGRLERCDEPGRDDIVAVVDYAHTPDALERLLVSVRSFTDTRVWCVFGCGGDRDRAKRGPMGEAVARAADVVIVTNDNPRSEDPHHIAEAVCAGLEGAAGRFEVELDRAKAIARAVSGAASGDVVVVAGKGHEPYQIIGDAVTSFDDRVELRGALARRRGEEPQ